MALPVPGSHALSRGWPVAVTLVVSKPSLLLTLTLILTLTLTFVFAWLDVVSVGLEYS
jgi:hypothetical protein